ncbi:MAG: hypothetical protein ACSHXK_13390 [Oceanococcus sp.]
MSAQKIIITLLTGLALLGLSGCNDIKSPTFTPRLQSVKVCKALSDNMCPTTLGACAESVEASPSLLVVDQSLQLCALGEFDALQQTGDDFTAAGRTYRNVTNQAQWSSANSAIVSVGKTGVAKGVAESASPIKITATLGSESGGAYVRVTPPTLDSVELDPNAPQVTVVGAPLTFQCEGTYSPSCPGTTSRTCDVTSDADFTSSDPSLFTISSDGRGVAQGATPTGGPVQVICSADDTTKTPPVPRESDPVTVDICPTIDITSLEFDPATVTIAVGAEPQQLELFANFNNCKTGLPDRVNVTKAPSTTLVSDDVSIASVNSDGLLTGENGGQAQITGSFAGYTAVLDVSVKFAEIRQINVTGPAVALAGVQTTLDYYAVAILQDVDTGADLGQEILMNAPDQPFAEWSSDSTAISFADANSGEATMLLTAPAQTVNISATYKGITGRIATQIVTVDTAVGKLEITPDVACVPDELSLGLPLGDPILQLDAHAILNYMADTDGDGVDEALSCSVIATQAADWSTSAAELTAQTLFGLVGLGPVLESLPLLGSCEDGTLLPVTVGEDPTGPPVEVGNGIDSNGDGDITGAEVKGNVGPNESTLNLAGGACIFANFDQTFGVDLGANRGVASALAAAELQAICEPLLATTTPSAASCAPEEPEAP